MVETALSRALPKDVQHKIDNYRKTAKLWQSMHRTCIVVAAVLAAAGAMPATIWGHEHYRQFVSAMAALVIVLVGQLRMNENSISARNAWLVLEPASVKYKLDPSYTLGELLTAYEKAQRVYQEGRTAKVTA